MWTRAPFLSLVVIGALLVAALQCSSMSQYEVTCNHGLEDCKVTLGAKTADSIAWGSVDTDSSMVTGWAYFDVEVARGGSVPDENKAYAAGFAEGFLTASMISNYWPSSQSSSFNLTSSEPVPEPVAQFIHANLQWMREGVEKNPRSPYWRRVQLVLAQLEGMVEGYKAAATKDMFKLGIVEFMTFQMNGDLEAVNARLNVTAMPDVNSWSQERLILHFLKSTHCSAMVQRTKSGNIYFGHTTWDVYSSMLRCIKKYNLPYTDPFGSAYGADVVIFSSTPAFLSSVDDYYLLSSGIAVTETTNGQFNPALIAEITPESMMSWMRVVVCNAAVTSAKDWVTCFEGHNSGTYDNQWIILQNNAGGLHLWIAEQIPGYVESAEITHVLDNEGGWYSYNRPYFPKIFNMSLFNVMEAKYGSFWNWEQCPRSQVFRRIVGPMVAKTDTMTAAKTAMRYNHWATDPESLGNACLSVSSRCDLAPLSPNPNIYELRSPLGGIDSKITDLEGLKKMEFWAQEGPTHDTQPPFEWSTEYEYMPHLGQPNRVEFGWELFGENMQA